MDNCLDYPDHQEHRDQPASFGPTNEIYHLTTFEDTEDYLDCAYPRYNEPYAPEDDEDQEPWDLPPLIDTSEEEGLEDMDEDEAPAHPPPWHNEGGLDWHHHPQQYAPPIYLDDPEITPYYTDDTVEPVLLTTLDTTTDLEYDDPMEILGLHDPPTTDPNDDRTTPSSPTYLEPTNMPGEEACAFPEDDALADNTHLSLAGLVDASSLSTEQYKVTVSLLEDNKDVFCFHPEQLGTCTLGHHVIDTGDAVPIKQAYYRMPYQKQEQLKAHVQQWLELGIIRPSNSPWASPMHLVPKKSGETRAVIDYRKLNSVTCKDAYPLPRIDDNLYNIGPAKYFSVVDLFSGYFQVPMAGVDSPDPHNSIAKTAFCCPWGLYEFTKVPFGLTNAPATFMRIMNEVLKAYIGKFVFVFLDDIIIYSNTLEEHLQHLELLFQALRAANMRLSSTKCRFATSYCTFLGFSVSADGLSCDARLVEAIALRPEPYLCKNPKKAVMSFLGLCSFYRRFVKGYAAIAEPLTRLTGKNQPFEWGAEQQHAFNTLKAKLMGYPILRRPDFSRPFFVHTDASQKAVGAVLTQKDEEGREYAVAYHSAKLSAAQTNWGITHLECYAVVNAVCDHWKDILLGHEFTVVTDHVALKWLMTSPNLQGKLARWSLRLQEFLPFSIQYRKGTQHLLADAMSRDPRHEDDCQETPTQELSTFEADYPHALHDSLDSVPTSLLTLEDTATPAPAPEPTPGASPSQGHSETPPLFEPPCTSDSDASLFPAPIRISVEGNIGCGKSTVIQHLQQLQEDPYWSNWFILPEPVADWHSLLDPFYGAPSGSTTRQIAATVLQQAVLNAYALRVPNPATAPQIITERSPWSSLAVFLPIQDLPPNMENVVHQAAHHMHATLDNALVGPPRPGLPVAYLMLRSTALRLLPQQSMPI
jgi:hypothetical protein